MKNIITQPGVQYEIRNPHLLRVWVNGEEFDYSVSNSGPEWDSKYVFKTYTRGPGDVVRQQVFHGGGKAMLARNAEDILSHLSRGWRRAAEKIKQDKEALEFLQEIEKSLVEREKLRAELSAQKHWSIA